MSKEIVILGFSPIGRELLEFLNEINRVYGYKRYKCLGFLDDNDSLWGTKYENVKILGDLGEAKKLLKDKVYFLFAIGNPVNYKYRNEIIRRIGLSIENFESIIHPSSTVSKLAKISNGTIVMQNSVISQNVKLGMNVIVSANCVLNHDVCVGNYTIFASGVNVAGNTQIGDSCYFGMNSTVNGNISIEDKAMIGMGSVVLKDVFQCEVVVGNPGKCIKI